MKDLPAFIMGMGAILIVLGLLVLIGPGVSPSQLDKCWVELKKAEPKCSTKQANGFTYLRDLRCIRAQKGIQLTAGDDTGWYRVVKLPDPAPPTVKGKSRARPETPKPEEK